MICPTCGKEIQDDTHFCIYCGAAVSPQSVPSRQIRTRRLNIVKVLNDTFTLYMRHFGTMCLVAMIFVGMTAAINVCQCSVQADMINAKGIIAVQPRTLGFIYGLALLAFLVQCYAMIVYVRQCLYTARSGAGLAEGLFFPPVFLYLKMIGFLLIYFCILTVPVCLATFVSILGAFVVFGPGPLSLLVAIFAAILFICWLAIRLSLAYYFLVDQNTGILDAFTKAWQASSKNFWALFGTFLLLFCPIICWMLACHGLAYGVGLQIAASIPGTLLLHIGSIPVVLLTWFGGGLAYLQLTGQPYRTEAEERLDFV